MMLLHSISCHLALLHWKWGYIKKRKINPTTDFPSQDMTGVSLPEYDHPELIKSVPVKVVAKKYS